MLKCWNDNPKERPSFANIIHMMNKIAGKCISNAAGLCVYKSFTLQFNLCSDKDANYTEVRNESLVISNSNPKQMEETTTQQ